MAPNFFKDVFQSAWHIITTNDRHASHNSPFRTGGHVPLSQSRHAPLTSVATSAFESRTDLAYPPDAPDSASNRNSNGHMSPNSPYSPGMRSALRRQSTDRASIRSSTDKTPVAEIQMQNFDQGLPPPPPVGHSWKRIERWITDNYQELYDNLCEGATTNDVNELEHELDCTLPVDVRESLQVHDGQERGGRPSGVLFGCMLLDCEEIVEEWSNWRKVNSQYLAKQPQHVVVQLPLKAFGAPSSSSSEPTIPVSQPKEQNSLWREELQNKQDSQPPNAVQKAYVHPSWIPLARDWGGNCIAVDLAPGPLGKWGQIIIFGRDYDCKFVIASSWSHFLARVADDFGQGDKIFVDEDSGELKFRQFRQQGVEPPYLEILRWRCDQRYGRRGPRGPRAGSPVNGAPSSALKINPNVVGAPPFDAAGSPYGSPTSAASERGRSPQRFPGKPLPRSMSTASPRRQLVSSPLARVAEETPAPMRSNTEPLFSNKRPSGAGIVTPVETPRASHDFPSTGFSNISSPTNGAVRGKENEPASQRGSVEGKESVVATTKMSGPESLESVKEEKTLVNGTGEHQLVDTEAVATTPKEPETEMKSEIEGEKVEEMPIQVVEQAVTPLADVPLDTAEKITAKPGVDEMETVKI